MDGRANAFLMDVLTLEGRGKFEDIRERVLVYLAECESFFRDVEIGAPQQNAARQRCRRLCRERVAREITWRAGTATERHLRMVLDVIDASVPVPPQP